jgi:hypothetical protein
MTDNIQEIRIDRIERYLEEFTKEFKKGMLELKAYQKETSEQVKMTLRQFSFVRLFGIPRIYLLSTLYD